MRWWLKLVSQCGVSSQLTYRIGLAWTRHVSAASGVDKSVNNRMGDMDSLRAKLAGKGLAQATERELARRKRCRLGTTFDGSCGAGQNERSSFSVLQHSIQCSLREERGADDVQIDTSS